ncbi:hypothetical protein [Bradyrhizobium sp. USDA 3458]|uniref:hypothetical protein n=1 Tax=Bradyrhizobium sp. USDA 3458 TaxID=2591461 RepID=UPI001330D810|nr:hypothetical protein [Bradyrhizobium sp. USDA 3458]
METAVKAGVDLSVGSRVTTLPENLTVGGRLSLSDTAITTLPGNLKLGGDL